MGGFVEQQLQSAVKAGVDCDSALGEAVALDDCKVNDMEVAIDEECIGMLAMRAPAAGDLRVIVAIIKTITDLDRIGDHAKNICEYVIYMAHGQDVRHVALDDVEHQLKAAHRMPHALRILIMSGFMSDWSRHDAGRGSGVCGSVGERMERA
ncbi:MAG TPA: PhoU domain-containing protein [Steroidobacteraceae bacterium]|jgi:phosphate transport system protein